MEAEINLKYFLKIALLIDVIEKFVQYSPMKEVFFTTFIRSLKDFSRTSQSMIRQLRYEECD